MKKTIITVIILFMFEFLFSGCAYSNMNIEGLLNAPKLSEEQSEIHKALTESTGNNIELKYPLSGNNRSAFVIYNLDDEPTDEAIAFYQKNNASSDESIIRINILDQINGKWQSVFDVHSVGTDVDKVILSKLGSDNQVNIIVGYGLLNQNEKALQIYNYSNGILNSMYSYIYSVTETIDMDMDNMNELITITKSNDNNEAVAKLFKWSNDTVINTSSIAMDKYTVSYTNIVKGMIDDETSAIYVDCLKSDGTLQTEVLMFKNNQLQNPLVENSLTINTSRPSGYFSTDINNDGVIEIPVTMPFTGYETNKNINSIVPMVNWNILNSDGNLENEFSSYYNLNDSYLIILNARWLGFVTVKEDTAADETVFHKYNKESPDNMTELMRISATTHQKSPEYKQKGYKIIKSQGQIDYLVKFGNEKEEQLVWTMDELLDNFYIL